MRHTTEVISEGNKALLKKMFLKDIDHPFTKMRYIVHQFLDFYPTHHIKEILDISNTVTGQLEPSANQIGNESRYFLVNDYHNHLKSLSESDAATYIAAYAQDCSKEDPLLLPKTILQIIEKTKNFTNYDVIRAEREGFKRSFDAHFKKNCRDYCITYYQGLELTGELDKYKLLVITLANLVYKLQYYGVVNNDIYPQISGEEHKKEIDVAIGTPTGLSVKANDLHQELYKDVNGWRDSLPPSESARKDFVTALDQRLNDSLSESIQRDANNIQASSDTAKTTVPSLYVRNSISGSQLFTSLVMKLWSFKDELFVLIEDNQIVDTFSNSNNYEQLTDAFWKNQESVVITCNRLTTQINKLVTSEQSPIIQANLRCLNTKISEHLDFYNNNRQDFTKLLDELDPENYAAEKQKLIDKRQQAIARIIKLKMVKDQQLQSSTSPRNTPPPPSLTPKIPSSPSSSPRLVVNEDKQASPRSRGLFGGLLEKIGLIRARSASVEGPPTSSTPPPPSSGNSELRISGNITLVKPTTTRQRRSSSFDANKGQRIESRSSTPSFSEYNETTAIQKTESAPVITVENCSGNQSPSLKRQ